MIFDIKMIIIIAILLTAVINDLYNYKVCNPLVLIYLILGTIYIVFLGKAPNFFSIVSGLILPFFLLIPLYMLKMLGAGDIKLLCAIGLLIGASSVLYSIAYSFLYGFAIAVLIMLVRKNTGIRIKKLFTYLRSCILTMSLMPYEEQLSKSEGRMHFTIPIALGTITEVILKAEVIQ